MFARIACALGLAATAVAQGLELPEGLSSFEPGTGTRGLWIPFQTVSDVSASIQAVNTKANVTVYVVACATAEPDCAIAPNITLTEGPTKAEYAVSNTHGAATVKCNFNDTMTINCDQVQRDEAGSNILKQSTTLAPSDITFQDIAITATMTNSSTIAEDTLTASSTGDKFDPDALRAARTGNVAAAQTAAPWGLGGAVAGGLLAVAAL